MFVNICGPQRNLVSPSIGCKLQKLHGMTQFPYQIQKYASAENFNGAYLESHLKSFVKRPSKRTRHTNSDFSYDLTIRWAEHISIEQYISSSYGSLDEHVFLSERFNNNRSHDRKKSSNSDKFTLMSSDDSFLLRLSPSKFYFERFGNDRTWYTCYGRNRLR